MASLPPEHIADAHKLNADGYVELFELVPSGGGTGTIRFKDSNDVTWRGNLYTGVPVQLTGEKKTADSGLTMPKMQIGQPNVDISMFKGLIYDGYLDNAIITRHEVLLTNMLANLNVKQTTVYRVKRVEQYSRSSISLQLATISDSLGFSIPYRTYLPPAFPSVQM